MHPYMDAFICRVIFREGSENPIKFSFAVRAATDRQVKLAWGF